MKVESGRIDNRLSNQKKQLERKEEIVISNDRRLKDAQWKFVAGKLSYFLKGKGNNYHNGYEEMAY